jgi:hypothetical protein
MWPCPYGVQYQPDKKHFKAVPTAERFQTPYHYSLQGQLWNLDETLWKLATKLRDYAPRQRRLGPAGAIQALLFPPTGEAASS